MLFTASILFLANTVKGVIFIDIKIRGVDRLIVQKIGKIAKERGLSREAYLREVLEQISNENHFTNYIEDRQNEKTELLLNVVKGYEKTVSQNTKSINEFNQIVKGIIENEREA